MTRAEGDSRLGTIRVLLLGVGRSVRAEVAQGFAACQARVSLLPAYHLTDATACVDTGQVDVILCGLPALAELRAAFAAGLGGSRVIPLVVLVPAGSENLAARAVEREVSDFLLQSGDYQVLLPALLRRALRREHATRAELTRLIRHEINNPLTGVLGNAELILSEEAALPPGVPGRLATIVSLVERIRDVLRTLEERFRQGHPLPNRALSPDYSRRLRVSGESMP